MVKEPSMFNVLYTIGPTKNGAQGIAAIKKAFKVDDKKAKDLLDKAIDFSSSGKIKTLTRSQQSMLNKQGTMKEEVIEEKEIKDLEEKNFDYAVLAKVLDADEKAVLQGRAKGLTYKQISDETGLSLTKARNLEWKALKKLAGKTGIALDDISRNLKGSMKDMKEAKDLDTKNVDKALAHDCAKHVVHEQWGEGNCIPHMHTLEEGEDGVGFVTHYDVMFEHGIEQNVPVEDLEIVVSENHMHSKKKKNEEMDPVGQADADIDNDGDVDSSDKYLHKRRKAISKALAKKKN